MLMKLGRSAAVAVVLVVAATATWAKDAEAPRVVPPQQAGVGRQLADFSATDRDGKPVRLEELLKGKQAIVVAVTSTTCPISKKYLPTLAALESEFAAKGIAFVFVNPIATDDAESMAKVIAGNKLAGPYIHDAKGALVAQLDAESTAECFLIDAKRTLLYRGAVDDQYGLGYNLAAPKLTFLKDALAALIGKKPISIGATTAPGCALEHTKDAATEVSKVTYHNRISRIVAAQCQECHRAGGVGPFPLETLEQIVAHKGMIRKVVEKGTMPPWHAAEETKYPGKWANDRSLTPNDKTDLLNWLKNGTPAGDAADAPLPRVYPGEWRIGKPDAIVVLPKPVTIPATGTMPYEHVTVATGLTEEKWIQAYEIIPTDRAVVHHVLVHIILPVDEKRAIGERLQNLLEESRGVFAAYVPGNGSLIYPTGTAKRLPKGAKLFFQIHYTPNGTATKDQLRLGMKFAANVPVNEAKVTAVANPRIKIPPMIEDHVETATMRARIPEGAVITAFMPHTHVRGKKCRYELIAPDGTTSMLLDVPHYDFNWQLRYELSEPMKVAQGSKIRFTVHYDNSPNNPANPDPKATVKWGQQTSEEMMLGYIEYHIPTPVKKP